MKILFPFAFIFLFIVSCGDGTSEEAKKISLDTYERKLAYSLGADRAKGIISNKKQKGDKLDKGELLKGFKKNFSDVQPPQIMESQLRLYGREGNSFNLEFVKEFSYNLGCHLGAGIYEELKTYEKLSSIDKELIFKGFEDGLNGKDKVQLDEKDQAQILKTYHESLDALYINRLLDHYGMTKEFYFEHLPYVLGVNNAKMISMNKEMKWDQLNQAKLVEGLRTNFSAATPPDLRSSMVQLYGDQGDEFHKEYLESFSLDLGRVVGFDIYRELTEAGVVDQVTPDRLIKGFEDGLKGKEDDQLELKQVKNIYTVYKLAAEKLVEFADNKFEGEDFLEQNAKKDGIKITDSGIQYEVINAGSGPKPKLSSFVTVHYKGTLIDGSEFDSSEGKDPVTFQVTGVIPGWTEILQIMPKGAKYRVYIPEELAYGSQNKGPKIRPYSMLIFDIELLEIK